MSYSLKDNDILHLVTNSLIKLLQLPNCVDMVDAEC